MEMKMTTENQQALMKLAFETYYGRATAEAFPKTKEYVLSAREEARYKAPAQGMSGYQAVIADDAYSARTAMASARIDPTTGQLTVEENGAATPAQPLAALELEGAIVLRTNRLLDFAIPRKPINGAQGYGHEYTLQLA